MSSAKRALSGTQWIQRGQDIDGEFALDYSGASVSISQDGTRIAIGALNNDGTSGMINNNQGHARVYQWNVSGSAWTQFGSDIDGMKMQSWFGYSLELSGDGNTLAIGQPRYTNQPSPGDEQGRVAVYKHNGSDWIMYGTEILGTGTYEQNGYSVSLSFNGDIVAMGSPTYDNSRGLARVFEMQSGSWVQKGVTMVGSNLGDTFGFSVSLNGSGNRVAVGAPKNNIGGQDAGHVIVYSWDGGTWTPMGPDIIGESAQSEAGFSVSINDFGDVLAVGAPYNYNLSSNGTQPLSDFGQVRVYDFLSGSWSQRGDDIDGQEAKSLFGHSVSIADSGNRFVVGAPGWHISSDILDINRGRVQVYEWNGSSWTQYGQDLDGEGNSDSYGVDVSISGDGRYIANGAHRNDGEFSGVNMNPGHVRAFEIGGTAGSPLIGGAGGGEQCFLYLFFLSFPSSSNDSATMKTMLTFSLL